MKNSISILLLAVLLSCKTGEKTGGSKEMTKDTVIPVIEIRSGQNSGFTEAVNKEIKTQAELEEVWTVLFANYLKKVNPPEIDFDNNLLVLVAAGEKTSGGYSIAVTKAMSVQNKLQLTVVNTSPGKNCVLTEAITYPYQLVQIQKTGQEVVFNGVEKTIDCESE